ncbi:MAG: hypothetical protein JWN15_2370 [Firmicutes bacterium]|nr:hypothetical protein [Bacillota bacterium]
MATAVARRHRPRRGRAWYLLACLLLSTAGVSCLLLSPPGAVRWASVLLLPTAAWSLLHWQQCVVQARARMAIGRRLSRLPADFLVLHGVVIPSPWGVIEVDHLILSRFGIVVVGDGPTPGWMLERVEAVRSLLFARGLAQPGLPMRPLILLPPGAAQPHRADRDASAIRVEQLSLEHLAPSRLPVLTASQIQLIARSLAGERFAA